MSSEDLILVESHPEIFVEKQVSLIKRIVGSRKVVAAVSGGIDSAVAAYLSWLSVPDNLDIIFLDTGFMRQNESDEVRSLFASMGIEIDIVDVKERFYEKTFGLSDAEKKRIAYREVFYSVLADEVRNRDATFLVQGTIAPDWIETMGGIKTQHNVLYQIGLRPEERYGYTVLEPLANLYKSQVRSLAKYLGFPEKLVKRQPFPGPGLLIRCVGDCNLEKLEVTRLITKIVEDSLRDHGFSQFFGVTLSKAVEVKNSINNRYINRLINFDERFNGSRLFTFTEKSTGVKGDARVYGEIYAISHDDIDLIVEKRSLLVSELMSIIPSASRLIVHVSDGTDLGKYSVVIRAVVTEDFMTADVPTIHSSELKRIGEEIIKKDSRVASVYYDLTSKPPATIEYE
ncbi:MAG: ATP-binding protein [Thermoprotei archaeon]|jgi:GMP synthase (glutamine-hydrolysing)